jgi:hypothetical protein
MDINKFIVGNIKLCTPIKIRIPDYGHDLPEIHSSSPISIPTYASVGNIINWLERGINIEFCNKEQDADRVLLFIMEYNKTASEENKKIKDANGRFNLALNAQDRLFRSLNFNRIVEKRKIDDAIPFKRKIYKSSRNDGSSISVSYNNPLINKKIPIREEMKKPNEVRAFDIFSPSGEMLISLPSVYDNIDVV